MRVWEIIKAPALGEKDFVGQDRAAPVKLESVVSGKVAAQSMRAKLAKVSK